MASARVMNYRRMSCLLLICGRKQSQSLLFLLLSLLIPSAELQVLTKLCIDQLLHDKQNKTNDDADCCRPVKPILLLDPRNHFTMFVQHPLSPQNKNNNDNQKTAKLFQLLNCSASLFELNLHSPQF